MSARCLARVTPLTVALCFLWRLLSVSVQAQEVATVEVVGGHAFLHDSENDGHAVGWFTGAQWNVTNWFSVAADAGANYREVSVPDVDSSSKARTAFGAFLAGPRLTLRRGRFAPFVHVLGGAVRFDATVTGLSPESNDHVTHGAIQLGGGLDAVVNRRFAVRIAADYRRGFVEEGGATVSSGNLPLDIPFIRRLFPSSFCCDFNQFRLTTGIVMRIGSR